jgi:hypothetical protein
MLPSSFEIVTVRTPLYIEPRIIRDLEPARELAALDAHLEHFVILELYQHVVVHEPRKR